MLEIKKLGEKTIRIADTATGRSYTGSATYKASSVGDIKIAATDPLKEQIRATMNARTNWTITGITLL